MLRPDMADGSTIGATIGAVRLATPSDQDALCDLLDALYLDNAEGVSIAKSDDKVRKHVEAACAGRLAVAGVVDAPDGRLRASIGIFATNPWYSDDWDLLSVYWLFERPEYRCGYAIFDALCAFADAHRRTLEKLLPGHPMLDVDFSFVSRERIPVRERLWTRHARKIGAIYLLNRMVIHAAIMPQTEGGVNA